MKYLYSPAEISRMTPKRILSILHAHGHVGWQVGRHSFDTPGGTLWIHAKTHAWAEYYPMVHWSPADIQLEHHLAVIMMKKYGFHHSDPIRPQLEAAIREYGPNAWKGKLRGIRSEKVQVPSRRLVEEYNPELGDKIAVYWIPDSLRRPKVVAYVKGQGRSFAFNLTRKQFTSLKRHHLRRPLRVSAKQIIPGWTPSAKTHRIVIR